MVALVENNTKDNNSGLKAILQNLARLLGISWLTNADATAVEYTPISSYFSSKRSNLDSVLVQDLYGRKESLVETK